MKQLIHDTYIKVHFSRSLFESLMDRYILERNLKVEM